jgi:splicing suppressor protein 51
MCRLCRNNCRGVSFDFQYKKFYHDYCESQSYSKPDLICFFNAGLHHLSSFKDFDTWPKTIEAAFNENVPVIVTSSTEYELPLDLERILTIIDQQNISIIQKPTKNPYASMKPERNFINEDLAPFFFKNLYYFIYQKSFSS